MITCEGCHKKIKDYNDVNVLAMFGVVPKTFCNNCYAAEERGLARHFVYWPRQPINGKIFNIQFMLVVLIWLFFLVITTYTTDNWPVTAILSAILLWYFALWRSAKNTIKKIKEQNNKT